MGWEIISANDPESVRECLKDGAPDLVLLDLYLKGFEGWQVLHDIKSWHPQTPVLIVTAYDNFKSDPRASQAEGYVVKSFTHLDELKGSIEGALSFK